MIHLTKSGDHYLFIRCTCLHETVYIICEQIRLWDPGVTFAVVMETGPINTGVSRIAQILAPFD